jgi:predicted transcriptional regulator
VTETAKGRPMRNHTKVIFLTADQLEERAAERIRQAEQFPPGEARQHALKNAAQLRSYAAMKRLLVPERTGGSAKEPSDVGG